MIKNKEYYQITGDLIADFGTILTDPIIKINVDSTGVVSTGLFKLRV